MGRSGLFKLKLVYATMKREPIYASTPSLSSQIEIIFGLTAHFTSPLTREMGKKKNCRKRI
jgi:hypothetical protein